jgi:hypothetical protein
MMVAATQILKRSTDFSFPDNVTVWMSSWGEGNSFPGKPPYVWHTCGTWVEESEYSGDLLGDHYNMCIDDSDLDEKFTIARQFGKVMSLHWGNKRVGSSSGSEGIYRASGVGNRCDCSALYADYNPSQCLGSREFTGKAQLEGYASFSAAVAMNARSAAGGVYVNNERLMKWTGTHGGTLVALPGGWPPPPVYFDGPYGVGLNDTSNVKWMEYECDPTGMAFGHFATHWDWTDFYWNIWAEGGTSNRYDAGEMAVIWNGYPSMWDPPGSQVASLCCQVDVEDNPTSCVKHNPLDVACGTGQFGSYPTTLTVGRLWNDDSTHDVGEGVIDDAWDMFGGSAPAKYLHFTDKGDATGVNH